MVGKRNMLRRAWSPYMLTSGYEQVQMAKQFILEGMFYLIEVSDQNIMQRIKLAVCFFLYYSLWNTNDDNIKYEHAGCFVDLDVLHCVFAAVNLCKMPAFYIFSKFIHFWGKYAI